jgi:hypothetical protein
VGMLERSICLPLCDTAFESSISSRASSRGNSSFTIYHAYRCKSTEPLPCIRETGPTPPTDTRITIRLIVAIGIFAKMRPNAYRLELCHSPPKDV